MSNAARLAGLACAAATIFAAAAAAAMPPPAMSVAEWAQAKRYVATSSQPGDWAHENAPYLVEPMERLTPSDPARRITCLFAAQMGKTEIALNWMGFIGDIHPRPVLYVLPSGDDYRDWNREQWQPNYEAQDGDNIFARRFYPPSKSGQGGQTEKFKPFPGGRLMVTGATSSKGLQRRSVCYLILDEISEYPADADGRGDPVRQARARQDAWGEEAKELAISTPKELPDCRITASFEAGDQGRFYVPCPHCRSHHVLRLENLFGWDGENFISAADLAKGKGHSREAVFKCPACGGAITELHKAAMVRAHGGRNYVRTYPGEDGNPAPPAFFPESEREQWRARPANGREPSFTVWQAYSLLKSWNVLLAEWVEAQGNPGALKTFMQQKAAEAWDAAGEAPDHEKLYEAVKRGWNERAFVPEGAWVLTCTADVQGDRIEYDVWAWGVGLTSWLVESGVIEGDPAADDVWRELAKVRMSTFRGENGFDFPIDMMGVDAGYQSGQVYRFCSGRQDTLALDGQGAPYLPPLGTPRRVVDAAKKVAAQLFPVGIHGLKSRLYLGLRLTLDGPDEETGAWPTGCVRLPAWISRDYVMQLTSETLVPQQTRGGAVRNVWTKIPGRRNERLDTWVYGCALASWMGCGQWRGEDWERIIAARGGARPTTLEALWSSVGVIHGTASAQPASSATQPAPAGGGDDERPWVETSDDWVRH